MLLGSAAIDLMRQSFYRAAAGAEIDLVLELGARHGVWAIEIKRSSSPGLQKGNHHALVDVGDLSTVLLCSVPPEQANYLQRVGRGGRRDGNSLALTVATSDAHD